MSEELSKEKLRELEQLSEAAVPPPWRSMIEGRDHTSGDSFIKIGEGTDRGEDMYVFRDTTPAGATELDVIAAARNALPSLIAEIRRLRGIN